MECYFKCKKSGKLTQCGHTRILNIITCSKTRDDKIHTELQSMLDENNELTISCHKSCVSSYTSKENLKYCSSVKKRDNSTNSDIGSTYPPAKRTRTYGTSFDFQLHCLFCGQLCDLVLDPKHPDRWRRVVLCRTADRVGKSFKDTLLEICDTCNDCHSEDVRYRLMSTISDLHAADARYHKDCYNTFYSKRKIISSRRTAEDRIEDDDSLCNLVQCMKEDIAKVWSSIDLMDAYTKCGGTLIGSRCLLLKQLQQHFGTDLVVLSSPGMANIVVFRSTGAKLIRLVESDEDDDFYLSRVASKIKKEYSTLKHKREEYESRLTMDIMEKEVSTTFMQLLSLLSDKLNWSLTALLMGNMLCNVVNSKPTPLQVDLAVMLRKKHHIEILNKFGVTCSYKELFHFKASAASDSARRNCPVKITDTEGGLIQVIVDNFDATLSTPNGLASTHALAMLVTQNSDKDEGNVHKPIRRISRLEMSNQKYPETTVLRANIPKKPEMPLSEALSSPLSLKIIANQVVSKKRADELDFAFMKSIVSSDDCPDYGGHNTKLCRCNKEIVRHATEAYYTPLIDMIPAHPDTVMTAMAEAQRISHEAGQLYTVLTADQQIQRVAHHVQWKHPSSFNNIIIRLGGMHFLMSFVGSIGNLMNGSGLKEILEVAFGGVTSMLLGKKFPQNVRSLRIVAIESIRSFLKTSESRKDLMQYLENEADKSRTTRHWLDNLVKPVMLMMTFIRAEREGNWPLHLLAVQEMLPYFFAAGHVNFARYGLLYLTSMKKLHGDALEKFMGGYHVTRHRKGLWNGIWSDMFIESTFMKYGHGPGGCIGITMKPKTLKTWAFSLHACSQIVTDINQVANGDDKREVTIHKEEGKRRIAADNEDRLKIRNKMLICIDPFDAESHPDEQIINVVSGKVGTAKVNVDLAVAIGKKQMVEFKDGWPQSFNNQISRKVVTLAATERKTKLELDKLVDPNLIFNRIMGLMSTRTVDVKKVMSFELSNVPTSMFTENGDIRLAKSKSTLKSKLMVEVGDGYLEAPDVVIIDGCALFWVIPWPHNVTVREYIDIFCSYIIHRLSRSAVHLVSDRYLDFSIKSSARAARASKHGIRRHHLTMSTPLPPQTVTLGVNKNKRQLISLVVDNVISKAMQCQLANSLVVTGEENIPTEIQLGLKISRNDLYTTHEEADVIIVQQMVQLAACGKNVIRVITDDTDVFVMLLHYYHELNLEIKLLMEGTTSSAKVLDIGKTVALHKKIVGNLLAAHALSGCDTVATYFGLGKSTIINRLNKNAQLSLLGKLDADFNEVMKEATSFIAGCYGCSEENSMTNARYHVWQIRIRQKNRKMLPKLQTLPPTTEAFELNVKRAHYQAAIWRSATKDGPPVINVLDYGWDRDEQSRILVPQTLPNSSSVAPDEILKMVSCNCSSTNPCSNGRCCCFNACLPCTVFCKCQLQENYCKSQITVAANTAVEDIDDDDYRDEDAYNMSEGSEEEM